LVNVPVFSFYAQLALNTLWSVTMICLYNAVQSCCCPAHTVSSSV